MYYVVSGGVQWTPLIVGSLEEANSIIASHGHQGAMYYREYYTLEEAESVLHTPTVEPKPVIALPKQCEVFLESSGAFYAAVLIIPDGSRKEYTGCSTCDQPLVYALHLLRQLVDGSMLVNTTEDFIKWYNTEYQRTRNHRLKTTVDTLRERSIDLRPYLWSRDINRKRCYELLDYCRRNEVKDSMLEISV